jgi:DNA-binding LacI/PurR family transcriptional regulator
VSNSNPREPIGDVALLYTAEATLDSPFDAALVDGVFAGLDGSGADLVILSARRSRRPGETLAQMLARKGLRGALLRTTTATQELCREATAGGAAVVVVGSRPDDPSLSCIYTESGPASREAVDHLLGLGHRGIAFGVHVVDDSDHADRLAGYRDALAAKGVAFDESLVILATADRYGGMQVVRRVASMSPRPTAVYLADPLMAVGALEEARRAGLRVPGDLSLVGFDDGDLRLSMVPHLTAVCQDTVGLGRAAAERLLALLSDPARTPRRSPLRCRFEIHETTSAGG